MLPVAHFADWSFTLVFLAPFLAVVLWVLLDNLRRRRADAREPGEER
jgi:cbb3-type cytochrome oxidase subunit 3